MKTKTLLLSVALAGAGAVSGVAQTVYSVNAVGFVNVVIPPGFSILANPLNSTDNTVGALFASAPNQCQIYKFSGAAYSPANTKGRTAWDNPGQTLVPGEAFFFKNSLLVSITNTFVGEVMQGTLTTPLTAGFQLVSSQVPQSGLVTTDLGLPMINTETVYRYVNNAYEVYDKGRTAWSPSEPIVGVGEGFFVKKIGVPGPWVRTFSVNQ